MMQTVFMLVPVAMSMLAWIGAIIFLISRRREYPRPATYALCAVSISLVMMLAAVVARILVAQVFDAQNIVWAFGMMSIITTLASIASLVLMLNAVFVDRDKPASATEDNLGAPLADNPDSNPYASPRK